MPPDNHKNETAYEAGEYFPHADGLLVGTEQDYFENGTLMRGYRRAVDLAEKAKSAARPGDLPCEAPLAPKKPCPVLEPVQKSVSGRVVTALAAKPAQAPIAKPAALPAAKPAARPQAETPRPAQLPKAETLRAGFLQKPEGRKALALVENVLRAEIPAKAIETAGVRAVAEVLLGERSDAVISSVRTQLRKLGLAPSYDETREIIKECCETSNIFKKNAQGAYDGKKHPSRAA